MKKHLSVLMIALLTVFASCSNDDDGDKTVYTVTFETDGGAPVPPVQRVEEGSMATVPVINPSKKGYVFSYWHVSGTTTAYNFQTPVSGNITLYAKWTTDNGGDGEPEGYTLFTSVSALNSWLANQSANSAETVYKVGLKNLNLDNGNNWGDLGRTIGETNKAKYVALDLSECTGTAIPDGHMDITGTSITYFGVFIASDRLLSIRFPKGLKTIGRYAFRNCKSLSSAPLPEGLLHINWGAFEYCDLRSVTLPEGLKTIDYWAFYSNAKITSITIPKSVTEVGDRAFMDCESLSSVVINANLETIEALTFCNTAIKTITIPASVTTLHTSALGSSFLEEIIMLPTTPPKTLYEIIEDIGGKALKRIKVPAGSVEAYKNAIVWRKRADIIVAF